MEAVWILNGGKRGFARELVEEMMSPLTIIRNHHNKGGEFHSPHNNLRQAIELEGFEPASHSDDVRDCLRVLWNGFVIPIHVQPPEPSERGIERTAVPLLANEDF
jgi:hypothetical protein